MIRGSVMLGVLVALAVLAEAPQAQAQVAVTTYYTPAAPVVTYVPERAGLFGLRTVYRPHVNYVAPATTVVTAPPVVAAPAATTTYYAPAATTTYYAPQPVTTYYAPAAAAPVTSYYAPAATAPVTSYYAPATVVTPAPTVVSRPVIAVPAPTVDVVPGY